MLQTMGFLVVMVWLVPFGFFVSTSVADNVLPSGPSETAKKQQTNIFIGLVTTVTEWWGRVVDGAAPGLGKMR